MRMLYEKMYDLIKRGMDLCIAVILLILTSPLFIIISIAIKAEDGGNILFFQNRVGKDNQVFSIIKFRSMHEGSENIKNRLTPMQYNEFIKEYKLESDPRRTKVGILIRESKLDELPQLLNVIFGKMSLVGPRPITMDELRYYTQPEMELLLKVRPGLTGLWQINDGNNLSYENGKRQAIEIQYVKHRSFLLDLTILLKTFFLIIRKVMLTVFRKKK